jgi:hypothetical protein
MIGGTSGYGTGETAIRTPQHGGVNNVTKKMKARIEIRTETVRKGRTRMRMIVKRGLPAFGLLSLSMASSGPAQSDFLEMSGAL